MKSLSLRAVLIFAGAFLLCFAVFATRGVPVVGGGEPVRSGLIAALAAGSYTLTSLAAVVFARGLLGLFFDFSRPVTFFRTLGGITDPFVALFGPVTPRFLVEQMRPFYAAFCLYFIKMLIFGGFGALPPWVFILFALG